MGLSHRDYMNKSVNELIYIRYEWSRLTIPVVDNDSYFVILR